MGKEKKSRKRKREHDKDKRKHKKQKIRSKEEEYIEELQWIEAEPINTTKISDKIQITEPIIKDITLSTKKRDDWMTNPVRKEKIFKKIEEKEKPYIPVELNPSLSKNKDNDNSNNIIKEEIKKPMLVGDGGASWRRKALDRAAEKARQEKRSLNEVLNEKYGTFKNKEDENNDKQITKYKFSEKELNLPKNRIKALLMKSKLAGNIKESERLQYLYDNLSIKVLSGLDEYGKKIQINKPNTITNSNNISNIEFDKDGERQRFFSDDNRTLQELVEEEKMGNDSNQTLLRNIIKNPKYKEPNISKDEEYDIKLYEKSNKKTKEQSEQEFNDALKRKQVKADNYYQKLIDECQYCYYGNKILKAGVISLGDYSYLSLPQYGQIVPGHCIIVPIEHCISIRTIDENTLIEINKFKTYLKRMFDDNGMEAIFMESACNFKKQYHTYIECIPLPKEIAEDAPLYFTKEIKDSGSKWSSNPKLINCKDKGGLKKSIPDNFEYFNVEFVTGDSYIHLIENKKFKKSFGRDIICGILDLPYGKKTRKKILQKTEAINFVKSFIKLWKPYDFTQYLEGGAF